MGSLESSLVFYDRTMKSFPWSCCLNLPELQEVTITLSGDVRDALTSFIDARQNAGHTVTLSHGLGIPSRRPLELFRL